MTQKDAETVLAPDWFKFVNRGAFTRSVIIAILIGGVLTVSTQYEWLAGSDSLRILPFTLAFVTPFVVVLVSQVVASRRAFFDLKEDVGEHSARIDQEHFLSTVISHGIPARALAIALAIGSGNALIVLLNSMLGSGDSTAVPVALLSQVILGNAHNRYAWASALLDLT